jgi:D-amino-acid dehydrogenase
MAQQPVSSTFSDFGNFNEIQDWSGFRPFRPSSIPLICEVKKYGNLVLNAGHGSLGWTLSAASGKILTDVVSGNKNEEFQFLEDEEKGIYS